MTMALGGMGVISVLSNILLKEVKKIAAPGLPNMADSLRTQQKLLTLIKALFMETNPSPVKYAMGHLGLCSPEVRLPLSEPRKSTKAEIAKRLDEFL